MKFSLDVEHRGSLALVKVTGDVDIYTAPQLDACLQQLVHDGKRNLAVDLSRCGYFDSEGIKALIRAYRTSGESASISIVGAQGTVERVFQISGLEAIFGIYASLDNLPDK